MTWTVAGVLVGWRLWAWARRHATRMATRAPTCAWCGLEVQDQWHEC